MQVKCHLQYSVIIFLHFFFVNQPLTDQLRALITQRCDMLEQILEGTRTMLAIGDLHKAGLDLLKVVR